MSCVINLGVDFTPNPVYIFEMATSTLIIYQPLSELGGIKDYWLEYARFYEKYWGGPTSPLGVWFGNEYEAFRDALSAELEMDEEHIEDCFFMKDGEGAYYIAPFGKSPNLLYSENYIPLSWFVLFEEHEREILYTHWGFNALHYDTSISNSLNRLKRAEGILDKVLHKFTKTGKKSPIFTKSESLRNGISNLNNELSRFDPSGYAVLNYGDVCSHIHPYTLKNENSVGEIWDILLYLNDGKIEEAESCLDILNHKWEDISKKAMGDIDENLIQ